MSGCRDDAGDFVGDLSFIPFSYRKKSYRKGKAEHPGDLGYQFVQGGLQNICSDYTYTPMVFKTYKGKAGKRVGTNFGFAQFFGLDFDNKDGQRYRSLEEGIALLEGVAYILGTTHSHLQDGKTEKFRAICAFEKSISDPEIYKKNVKRLAEKYHTDTSATASCQAFYSFKEIVKINLKGLFFKVEPIGIDPKIIQAQRQALYIAVGTNKTLPKNVHNFIYHGKVFGDGRQRSCFVSASEMIKRGFNQSEIELKLKNSPFSREGDWEEEELYHAINQAFKYHGR